MPCATPTFPAIRGSAYRPPTARIDCLACTNGNSSASPEEARRDARLAMRLRNWPARLACQLVDSRHWRADHRADGTHHAGIIGRAGPRAGPRLGPFVGHPVTVRNTVASALA